MYDLNVLETGVLGRGVLHYWRFLEKEKLASILFLCCKRKDEITLKYTDSTFVFFFCFTFSQFEDNK